MILSLFPKTLVCMFLGNSLLGGLYADIMVVSLLFIVVFIAIVSRSLLVGLLINVCFISLCTSMATPPAAVAE